MSKSRPKKDKEKKQADNDSKMAPNSSFFDSFGGMDFDFDTFQGIDLQSSPDIGVPHENTPSTENTSITTPPPKKSSKKSSKDDKEKKKDGKKSKKDSSDKSAKRTSSTLPSSSSAHRANNKSIDASAKNPSLATGSTVQTANNIDYEQCYDFCSPIVPSSSLYNMINRVVIPEIQTSVYYLSKYEIYISHHEINLNLSRLMYKRDTPTILKSFEVMANMLNNAYPSLDHTSGANHADMVSSYDVISSIPGILQVITSHLIQDLLHPHAPNKQNMAQSQASNESSTMNKIREYCISHLLIPLIHLSDRCQESCRALYERAPEWFPLVFMYHNPAAVSPAFVFTPPNPAGTTTTASSTAKFSQITTPLASRELTQLCNQALRLLHQLSSQQRSQKPLPPLSAKSQLSQLPFDYIPSAVELFCRCYKIIEDHIWLVLNLCEFSPTAITHHQYSGVRNSDQLTHTLVFIYQAYAAVCFTIAQFNHNAHAQSSHQQTGVQLPSTLCPSGLLLASILDTTTNLVKFSYGLSSAASRGGLSVNSVALIRRACYTLWTTIMTSVDPVILESLHIHLHADSTTSSSFKHQIQSGTAAGDAATATGTSTTAWEYIAHNTFPLAMKESVNTNHAYLYFFILNLVLSDKGLFSRISVDDVFLPKLLSHIEAYGANNRDLGKMILPLLCSLDIDIRPLSATDSTASTTTVQHHHSLPIHFFSQLLSSYYKSSGVPLLSPAHSFVTIHDVAGTTPATDSTPFINTPAVLSSHHSTVLAAGTSIVNGSIHDDISVLLWYLRSPVKAAHGSQHQVFQHEHINAEHYLSLLESYIETATLLISQLQKRVAALDTSPQLVSQCREIAIHLYLHHIIPAMYTLNLLIYTSSLALVVGPDEPEGISRIENSTTAFPFLKTIAREGYSTLHNTIKHVIQHLLGLPLSHNNHPHSTSQQSLQEEAVRILPYEVVFWGINRLCSRLLAVPAVLPNHQQSAFSQTQIVESFATLDSYVRSGGQPSVDNACPMSTFTLEQLQTWYLPKATSNASELFPTITESALQSSVLTPSHAENDAGWVHPHVLQAGNNINTVSTVVIISILSNALLHTIRKCTTPASVWTSSLFVHLVLRPLTAYSYNLFFHNTMLGPSLFCVLYGVVTHKLVIDTVAAQSPVREPSHDVTVSAQLLPIFYNITTDENIQQGAFPLVSLFSDTHDMITTADQYTQVLTPSIEDLTALMITFVDDTLVKSVLGDTSSVVSRSMTMVVPGYHHVLLKPRHSTTVQEVPMGSMNHPDPLVCTPFSLRSYVDIQATHTVSYDASVLTTLLQAIPTSIESVLSNQPLWLTLDEHRILCPPPLLVAQHTAQPASLSSSDMTNLVMRNLLTLTCILSTYYAVPDRALIHHEVFTCSPEAKSETYTLAQNTLVDMIGYIASFKPSYSDQDTYRQSIDVWLMLSNNILDALFPSKSNLSSKIASFIGDYSLIFFHVYCSYNKTLQAQHGQQSTTDTTGTFLNQLDDIFLALLVDLAESPIKHSPTGYTADQLVRFLTKLMTPIDLTGSSHEISQHDNLIQSLYNVAYRGKPRSERQSAFLLGHDCITSYMLIVVDCLNTIAKHMQISDEQQLLHRDTASVAAHPSITQTVRPYAAADAMNRQGDTSHQVETTLLNVYDVKAQPIAAVNRLLHTNDQQSSSLAELFMEQTGLNYAFVPGLLHILTPMLQYLSTFLHLGCPSSSALEPWIPGTNIVDDLVNAHIDLSQADPSPSFPVTQNTLNVTVFGDLLLFFQQAILHLADLRIFSKDANFKSLFNIIYQQTIIDTHTSKWRVTNPFAFIGLEIQAKSILYTLLPHMQRAELVPQSYTWFTTTMQDCGYLASCQSPITSVYYHHSPQEQQAIGSDQQFIQALSIVPTMVAKAIRIVTIGYASYAQGQILSLSTHKAAENSGSGSHTAQATAVKEIWKIITSFFPSYTWIRSQLDMLRQCESSSSFDISAIRQIIPIAMFISAIVKHVGLHTIINFHLVLDEFRSNDAQDVDTPLDQTYLWSPLALVADLALIEGYIHPYIMHCLDLPQMTASSRKLHAPDVKHNIAYEPFDYAYQPSTDFAATTTSTTLKPSHHKTSQGAKTADLQAGGLSQRLSKKYSSKPSLQAEHSPSQSSSLMSAFDDGHNDDDDDNNDDTFAEKESMFQAIIYSIYNISHHQIQYSHDASPITVTSPAHPQPFVGNAQRQVYNTTLQSLLHSMSIQQCLLDVLLATIDLDWHLLNSSQLPLESNTDDVDGRCQPLSPIKFVMTEMCKIAQLSASHHASHPQLYNPLLKTLLFKLSPLSLHYRRPLSDDAHHTFYPVISLTRLATSLQGKHSTITATIPMDNIQTHQTLDETLELVTALQHGDKQPNQPSVSSMANTTSSYLQYCHRLQLFMDGCLALKHHLESNDSLPSSDFTAYIYTQLVQNIAGISSLTNIYPVQTPTEGSDFALLGHDDETGSVDQPALESTLVPPLVHDSNTVIGMMCTFFNRGSGDLQQSALLAPFTAFINLSSISMPSLTTLEQIGTHLSLLFAALEYNCEFMTTVSDDNETEDDIILPDSFEASLPQDDDIMAIMASLSRGLWVSYVKSLPSLLGTVAGESNQTTTQQIECIVEIFRLILQITGKVVPQAKQGPTNITATEIYQRCFGILRTVPMLSISMINHRSQDDCPRHTALTLNCNDIHRLIVSTLHLASFILHESPFVSQYVLIPPTSYDGDVIWDDVSPLCDEPDVDYAVLQSLLDDYCTVTPSYTPLDLKSPLSHGVSPPPQQTTTKSHPIAIISAVFKSLLTVLCVSPMYLHSFSQPSSSFGLPNVSNITQVYGMSPFAITPELSTPLDTMDRSMPLSSHPHPHHPLTLSIITDTAATVLLSHIFTGIIDIYLRYGQITSNKETKFDLSSQVRCDIDGVLLSFAHALHPVETEQQQQVTPAYTATLHQLVILLSTSPSPALTTIMTHLLQCYILHSCVYKLSSSLIPDTSMYFADNRLLLVLIQRLITKQPSKKLARDIVIFQSLLTCIPASLLRLVFSGMPASLRSFPSDTLVDEISTNTRKDLFFPSILLHSYTIDHGLQGAYPTKRLEVPQLSRFDQFSGLLAHLPIYNPLTFHRPGMNHNGNRLPSAIPLFGNHARGQLLSTSILTQCVYYSTALIYQYQIIPKLQTQTSVWSSPDSNVVVECYASSVQANTTRLGALLEYSGLLQPTYRMLYNITQFGLTLDQICALTRYVYAILQDFTTSKYMHESVIDLSTAHGVHGAAQVLAWLSPHIDSLSQIQRLQRQGGVSDGTTKTLFNTTATPDDSDSSSSKNVKKYGFIRRFVESPFTTLFSTLNSVTGPTQMDSGPQTTSQHTRYMLSSFEMMLVSLQNLTYHTQQVLPSEHVFIKAAACLLPSTVQTDIYNTLRSRRTLAMQLLGVKTVQAVVHGQSNTPHATSLLEDDEYVFYEDEDTAEQSGDDHDLHGLNSSLFQDSLGDEGLADAQNATNRVLVDKSNVSTSGDNVKAQVDHVHRHWTSTLSSLPYLYSLFTPINNAIHTSGAPIPSNTTTTTTTASEQGVTRQVYRPTSTLVCDLFGALYPAQFIANGDGDHSKHDHHRVGPGLSQYNAIPFGVKSPHVVDDDDNSKLIPTALDPTLIAMPQHGYLSFMLLLQLAMKIPADIRRWQSGYILQQSKRQRAIQNYYVSILGNNQRKTTGTAATLWDMKTKPLVTLTQQILLQTPLFLSQYQINSSPVFTMDIISFLDLIKISISPICTTLSVLKTQNIVAQQSTSGAKTSSGKGGIPSPLFTLPSEEQHQHPPLIDDTRVTYSRITNIKTTIRYNTEIVSLLAYIPFVVAHQRSQHQSHHTMPLHAMSRYVQDYFDSIITRHQKFLENQVTREIVGRYMYEGATLTLTLSFSQWYPVHSPSFSFDNSNKASGSSNSTAAAPALLAPGAAKYGHGSITAIMSHNSMEYVRQMIHALISTSLETFNQLPSTNSGYMLNECYYSAISNWSQAISEYIQEMPVCGVCLSVLHDTSKDIPSIQCAVCEQYCHPTCLFNWFKEKNVSTCPLCRASF